MSPLCGIFENPVFERPYSDLNIFSHVSCTRKLKKTCKKTLKTFLAAHYENTHLKITHGSENVKKTTPLEVQMDDLATKTAPLFPPGWPFGLRMGAQISNNTVPACTFYEKSLRCSSTKHPQAPKAVKMGSYCRSDQSKPKFFPDGGLSSKLYIYIYIYISGGPCGL